MSVVLPVWNGEPFLREALDSVDRQRWRAFEIVVVDDGSTDGSASVAGTYPGVHLFRQARAGVAAARNRGVAASRGELIAFLDQDDRYTSDKLERQVGAFQADPALDLCFAHQRLFLDGLWTPPSWIRPGWLDGPLPGLLPGTLVVRRRAFDAVGPFTEGEPIASDSDWLMRARRGGLRELLLPDVLLERRIHAANQSANVAAGHVELLRAIRRAVKRGTPSEGGASA